ncbi:pilus assembly protein [Chloroflexia bacterium SDU3-3]|nr:pilus assembly protein [Chloroflexia bacterium SDU3-3]
MRQFSKSQAQAMVEFALAATLIFFLLAAAIDLGFLFFTKQGLTSAAQEGAMYGSNKLKSRTGGGRELDYVTIQSRVRYESGDTGGNGISNLLDLNSNGKDDIKQESGVIDSTGKTGYIKVLSLADNNVNGNPTDDGGALCEDPSKSTVPCYVYVSVTKVHRMFFPLSPSFDNSVNVTSSYYLLIRDSFRTGSGTENYGTPTATPNANQLVIEPDVFSSTFTDLTKMPWTFKAYDKGVGTSNGAGIQNVQITFAFPGGSPSLPNGADSAVPYCVFGGATSCKSLSQTSLISAMDTNSEKNALNGKTFMITVTATGNNGVSVSNTFTTVYKK